MGAFWSLGVLVVEANSTLACITREPLYAAGVRAVSCVRDTTSARQSMEPDCWTCAVPWRSNIGAVWVPQRPRSST